MYGLKEDLFAAVAWHWIRLLTVITSGKQVIGGTWFLFVSVERAFSSE